MLIPQAYIIYQLPRVVVHKETTLIHTLLVKFSCLLLKIKNEMMTSCSAVKEDTKTNFGEIKYLFYPYFFYKNEFFL